MNIAIRYDKGMGNAEVYARLLGPSGFWNFLNSAWDATETAATRAFMPELADSSTETSWYQSTITPPSGGPYAVEYVRISTGAVIGNDISAYSSPPPEVPPVASAQIIQFLLSPVRSGNTVLSLGKVYFYAAGTSTLKDVWLDRYKTEVAANPYTLDSNGTAHLYADGLYRIVIKDAAGAVKFDRDYLSFSDSSAAIADLNAAIGAKSVKNVSDYADLAAAVSAIGSTPATLAYGTDQTVTGNITIPSNIELYPYNCAVINHGNYTVSYAGSTARWPLAQVFNGTGAVSGFTEARPEWFGGTAAAMTKALNLNGNAKGSTILTGGKVYDITGGVSLTTQYKTIVGNGAVLEGGMLTIGSDSGLPVDMHFTVRGVDFRHSALSTGDHGITLHNARYGLITGCKFTNCDKAINIASIDNIQHVNRLQVTGNDFDNVNYCLYSAGKNAAGGTKRLTVGDIDFSHNLNCYAKTTHLYLTGQDGYIIKGNYFFFPGYAALSATKEYNIYIDYAANGQIEGNQLFEAGYDAIYGRDLRRTLIQGNGIDWPGQRVPGCGIRLVNEILNGLEANNNLIQGNQINYATLHGIYTSEQNKQNIQDNIVDWTGGYFSSVIGVTTYYSYYGTSPARADLATYTTHYTVHLADVVNGNPNAKTLFCNNNLHDTRGVMPSYPSSSPLYFNDYYGNLTPAGDAVRMIRYVTQTAVVTSLDAAAVDVLNVELTGPATVTAITGGLDGKQIQLVFFNGNCTLDDQALGETVNRMVLRGAANVTPVNGNIITLQYFTDRWKEISRNF